MHIELSIDEGMGMEEMGKIGLPSAPAEINLTNSASIPDTVITIEDLGAHAMAAMKIALPQEVSLPLENNKDLIEQLVPAALKFVFASIELYKIFKKVFPLEHQK